MLELPQDEGMVEKQSILDQIWLPLYGVSYLIQPHPPSEGGGQVGFALHRAEFFEFARENRHRTYLDMPWSGKTD